MKLSEYLKNLNDQIKENPSLLEAELIYSIDEEGNDYHKLDNYASPCQIEPSSDYYVEIVGFAGEDTIDNRDINAICIN